jgi:hypothetical protein
MSEPNYMKLYKRFLETNVALSELYLSLNDFLEEKNEENIKDVSSKIEFLNRTMDALNNGLKVALESSVEIESDEVDAVPTENGFKLN